MMKKAISYLLWLLLAYFALSFLYSIYTKYLFTTPSTWPNEILIGLGNLYIPALGIYLHFWGGILILGLGLLQILPLSRKNMLVHRIIGNIYILACLVTSIGGNIYIYSNGTSGGINMNIAFSIYGWLLFIVAIITYIQARRKKINSHRDWGIRLWALGWGSLFYRLSYHFLFSFGYPFKSTYDFFRPLDMFLDWWFFMFPLVLAEAWIQRSWILSTLSEVKKRLVLSLFS